MGQIRKQTIFSSLVIYIGFVIGFINTYLYVKNGTFTTEQYGLVQLFGVLGITFYSFASFGVGSYIFKFHPFYKQNLSDNENDQPAVSVAIVTVGFILVVIAAILFKPLFIRKYSGNSRLLISYYYWILPYAFGLLYFTVFEGFAWFAQKGIFTNFLKETAIRLFQSIIIVCFIAGLISFSTFIKAFSFSFLLITSLLLWHLVRSNNIHFNFKISRVTRKFHKKFLWLMTLIYGSVIVNTLAQYVDSIIIASISKGGLKDVGVFTLATFITTTIQVPQRGILAAVLPVLSNSWKSKNYNEIRRIYSRTSINLLLLALLIFFNIWINIHDLFTVAKINIDYEAGTFVILILGISKIIDAGTGVNSQIIGTSNLWKFEVFTGIMLLAVSIPLNYFLVKRFGINGSAISNLIAFGLYNIVRLVFIWVKFKMQPFSIKTLYAIISALLIYAACFFLFRNLNNLLGIIIRSFFFTSAFVLSIFILKLTPDAFQLLDLAKEKFRRRNA